MKIENRYFDVSPRIVPADAESTITITPLFGHSQFLDDVVYELSYFPVEEFALHGAWRPEHREPVTPTDGELRIPQYFEGEQEHVLFIEAVTGDTRKVVGDFRIYSLNADLYGRRPYRGDFHMHSYRSDGKESPAYVAGAARRIGLDFMALTDHRQYEPSIEAQQAYGGVDIDLRLVPGEEVHPPDNPVHIVNFGGRFSINDLIRDEDTYRSQVDAVQQAVGAVPPGVDAYQYASCLWCYDRIREAGGLGLFCHPYWFTQHRYSPSGALTTHLFDTQPFDAYE
ncbi:MAG: hypothetical protein JXR94_02730, partial [Candidatus Hydrogenedentes bacterium]|nr:hypothetical protein [Candidatus Hydrogenedentota bacterium]